MMATIGYRTTTSGEDMMRQIARIVAAGGRCEVTRGAYINGKMFQPLEMSASQMSEHITGLLGGTAERLPDLPRTEELALDALAAKHGLAYELNPQTRNWIFKAAHTAAEN
jgi:hypothetical protein